MGRAVALTKKIFKKKMATTVEAKTPTAPANVCFLIICSIYSNLCFKMKVIK